MRTETKTNQEPPILITGGAGFIGSALTRLLLEQYPGQQVLVLDKLTYAGNRKNLSGLPQNRLLFVQGDIGDKDLIISLLQQYAVQKIIHLAAETHVDRSIADPQPFIQTNIQGTATLLEAARDCWSAFRDYPKLYTFLHISTDEVYGPAAGPAFAESSALFPTNPYSATKAAAEAMVLAWHNTYGFPGFLSRATNSYGPRQYPEKLLPLALERMLAGKKIPVYGNGSQSRDWLYVKDHAAALLLLLEQGIPGEIYNIAGNCEQKNLEVLQRLFHTLQPRLPEEHPFRQCRFEQTVEHVPDRPAHDRRYAIDDRKLRTLTGWKPETSLDQGLEALVRWRLEGAPD